MGQLLATMITGCHTFGTASSELCVPYVSNNTNYQHCDTKHTGQKLSINSLCPA